MVRTAFAKLKYMVTMRVNVLGWLKAVLTHAAITRIDVLFQPDPVVNLRPPEPRELTVYFWKPEEISHTSPCPAAPGHAFSKSCRAMPLQAKPSPQSAYL